MTGLQYLIHDTHMMKAVLTTNERKVGAPWPSSMPMEEQPTFYSFRRQQTMWNHVGEFARWYITHKYGAWGGTCIIYGHLVNTISKKVPRTSSVPRRRPVIVI